ncbi:hypothetical protein Y032_0240g3340 [Ancylostoma ceylanicum]|uniref:Choline/carnitine acyltransferase domain-containing protein n=2 Tax=Ancylostoma ceylanicum TaxID=53326 RepID=A0A016SEP4_9BILA|nr:hypothetical protein Y032_0240g3340 [Ancylostoma ceylanicum]
MSSGGNGAVGPIEKPLPLPKKFPTPFERSCYKFYASVDNRLWPVRPIYFVAGAASLGAIQVKYGDIPLFNVVPVFTNKVVEWTKICVVSLAGAYIPIFILRQFLSYFYFSYKGFLFEDPKKPSITTRLWGICRQLLSFSTPMLKSCDNLLPSPSVPDLDETVAKYLKSVRNILRKEEFALVKEQAQSFLKNEGRRLHMYAWIMSMMSDNYITPFWEKYAYLYNREPLLITSSVAHTDLIEIPQHRRATRAYMAARVTFFEAMSHLAIDRQAIEPLGSGLLCACHYDKLYSVCRVPGEQIDELVNYGISKHVVAILDGCFYKVMICDGNNRIYSIDQLAKIYAELLSRNDVVEGPAGMVAALTTDKRDEWARNREKFFLKHPKNAATLKEIESAAFILTLEDGEYGYDPKNPDKLSNFLRNMLTGNGVNRWADKSLNYVVSKNSRCGGTTEHSIGDGSEFDHIMENFVTMELLTEYPSLEEQQRIEKLTDGDRNLTLAIRLPVEVNTEMGAAIQRCYTQYEKLREDVDVAATVFREFGKGFIKKCGVSPDGFMQMAIQLANYRDQGRFVLTYEPASARFYKNSRTETLRTVTDESCEFVYAMVNGKATKEEKIKRLRAACELHTRRNREAMVGGGIDRHLFVLYVLSQGTSISSPFLDHYISQPWLLSTSHVPNVTNQIDEDTEQWKTWSGACFGAVAKKGYGVCYRFGGNHSIMAHITSYKSAENTNSAKFRKQLETAFREMAELFSELK